MVNLSNIEIKNDDNKTFVKINPKIYPLDVIYSSAYVFLDKAYILLTGDPKKEIIIEIQPKDKKEIESIGKEFNNELLNYANYKIISEKNNEIRTAIIQRALLTNDSSMTITNNANDIDEETKKLLKELENEEDEDYFDDPEGIAIPWEEKYGKKKSKDKT